MTIAWAAERLRFAGRDLRVDPILCLHPDGSGCVQDWNSEAMFRFDNIDQFEEWLLHPAIYQYDEDGELIEGAGISADTAEDGQAGSSAPMRAVSGSPVTSASSVTETCQPAEVI